MKSLPAIVVALATVASLAADSSQISDTALRDYRNFHKMTDKPHSVAAALAIQCSLTPDHLAAQKRTGPHFGYWVNVYMNDSAKTHFEAKDVTVFPPGSIVVKEKLLSFGEKEDVVEAAVAGMIKHPPGYDAKAGDWEFFYFEKNGKMERGSTGKFAACADCHHEAGRDFIFGDFAKPEAAIGRVAQPE
jgi:hypothetical protein